MYGLDLVLLASIIAVGILNYILYIINIILYDIVCHYRKLLAQSICDKY